MLYIGIDGGGTKTKMALFDDAGRKLKEIIKPSVHVLTQPREICIQILKDGVMELDANFQAKVIAGLAGYGEQKEVRNKIATICKEAFGNREFSLYSQPRSEEHTSELQSLPRNSYAVFCLKKKIALLRCFSSGGSPHMPMDSAYVTWTFLHVFFFLMIRRPPRSTPL